MAAEVPCLHRLANHMARSRCGAVPHRSRQTSDALAGVQRLPDKGWAQRTWQPDPEHHGKAADLVFQSDPLADQLLARDDQRADSVCRQGLHMNGLEETGAGEMSQAACIVAVGLV